MDRVAAEVAQEVRVFLEYDDVDSGTRQQQAKDHSGWTAAGDAASCALHRLSRCGRRGVGWDAGTQFCVHRPWPPAMLPLAVKFLQFGHDFFREQLAVVAGQL